jgi:septal ring-binding cell division protein DamX
VTGHGPPDDPSEAPTGYYDYSDSGDDGHEPKHRPPWYRNPIVLVALGLFAAILLGLVLYFLADQTHGSGGTTQTPTSPTTSTGVAPTTTTEAPTTEPIAPAPTTTMTFPPTTTEPTTAAPATTPTPSTSVDEGRHHHHHHDGGTP